MNRYRFINDLSLPPRIYSLRIGDRVRPDMSNAEINGEGIGTSPYKAREALRGEIKNLDIHGKFMVRWDGYESEKLSTWNKDWLIHE